MRSDPFGVFFLKYDLFCLVINKYVNNLLVKFSMQVREIRYGDNCQFYGRTYFRRMRLSSINIGNKCRFRSSFKSNYIGINRPCFISTLRKGAKINIGDNVGMSGTIIGCAESIFIGNNVLIGANSTITDFDWHSTINRDEMAISKPVVIDDDVFIGLNVIVLKGSYIGKGSVIGANSVVSGIIPPGVIAAGNPCKVIRYGENN